MQTSDVIKYFGGNPDDPDGNAAAIKAIASALGIKVPSVYGWEEVVPPLRQLQLERITKGKLKADPSILATPSPQQAAGRQERRIGDRRQQG